ncbi:MAG: ELKS/Rab6-interacting/CAST family protein [Pirellulales bacterium]|nr:ELKS/Rab6-interacting/CAST family protein [Pirellulales bacterium]
MSTLGKVFAGLVIVAALGFFFLGMLALQAHRSWGEANENAKQQLEQAIEQVKVTRWGQLQGGKLVKPGIVQKVAELHGLLVDRGRVWYQVTPSAVDPMTGATSVEVANPSPHQIVGGSILNVFEDKPRGEGGQFLGQFRVTGLEGDTKVALAPAMTMSPESLQRLAASQAAGGTWTIYELLPRDRHELFTTLDDEAQKALLPAETVQEYLKDGKDADPNDPQDRQVDRKYVRRLRDYNVLFRDLDQQMAVLRDRVASAEVDQQNMDAALADAQKHVEFERATIASLKTELAELQAELTAVTKHRETLEAGLAQTRADVARLVEANEQLVDQLAAQQGVVRAPGDRADYEEP